MKKESSKKSSKQSSKPKEKYNSASSFKLIVLIFSLFVFLTFFTFLISSNQMISIESRVIEELKEDGKVKVAILIEKKDESEKEKVINNIVDTIDKKVKHRFDNLITLEIDEKDLEELEKLKEKNIKIFAIPKREIFLQDTINIVNATRAWEINLNGINITGAGETVCIIDTGVNHSHPDLSNNTIGGYDYCADNDNCNTNDEYPEDVNGHGTHVAGIIAANGSIKGIAPDAKIIMMKVCNVNGYCYDDDIKAGIDWCVNNSSAFNISVISISLGGGLYNNYCDFIDDPLNITMSIYNALAKNISVIAATGNSENTTHIGMPACIRNVTAVGATTKADVIASYSNRNNITDLLAPGSNINSTCLIGYCTKSGTSMAVPHVSASFALLKQFKTLEKSQILTPQQIQNVLNISGKRIYDTGTQLNFSRIDIFSAIAEIDETPPKIYFNAGSDNGTIERNYILLNLSVSDEVGIKNLTARLYFYSTLANETNTHFNYNKSLDLLFNFTDLNDGEYFFDIAVSDKKNINRTNRSIAIDAMPRINFINPTPENDSKLNINWTSINVSIKEKNPSLIIINWNGTNETYNIYNLSGENSSYWLFINKTDLQDGIYEFSAFVNDTAERSNETETRRIMIDTVLPSISVISPLNITYNNKTILLNISAFDENVDTVWYNWNGTNVSYNESENITFSEGFICLNAFINDTAGNMANTSVCFTVDTVTPPIIVLEFPQDNFYHNKSQVIFNCSLSDATGLSNITLLINGIQNETKNISGNYNSTTFSKNFNDGSYVWSCYACDILANCNQANNRTLVIDTIVPTIHNVLTSTTTTTATITWQTNELTNGSLIYGTTKENLSYIIEKQNYSMNHSLTINGLSASTTYYFNITSCDLAKNCVLLGIFNFTTQALMGGGGGGGGGVSDGEWITRPAEITEESTNKTIETIDVTEDLKQLVLIRVKITKNQRLKFDIKGEHYAEIREIGVDYVLISIRSNEKNVKIFLNETAFFDLDNDGKDDIAITLEGIEDEAVKLFIAHCECKECQEWSECKNGTRVRDCYKCTRNGCRLEKEIQPCVIQKPKAIDKAKMLKIISVLAILVLTIIVTVITSILIKKGKKGKKERKKGERRKKEMKEIQTQEKVKEK